MLLMNTLKFYRYNPHAIEVALRYRYKLKFRRKLLGVAVLGCGGGGLMHASHYLWHPETDLRAVFDINGHRFSDLARRFPYMKSNVSRSTELKSVLENPDVEAVSVCTPDHTHADYVVAALEAGKHVLCEKPMCTNLKDCERIIQSAESVNRVFSVFQQMRFVPRNQMVKKMVTSGELGELFFVETGYIHDMRKRATEFSEWRMDANDFQHPIFGGCHHIDLIRWLAGEVEQVHTYASHKGLPHYPVEDTYVTSLRFANGAVGSVLTSFGPRIPREFHPIRIYGTGGSIHDQTAFLDRDGHIVSKLLKERSYRGVPDFRAQISHFVDCVRRQASPLVTARDGAATVATCLAVVESAMTGRPQVVQNIGT